MRNEGRESVVLMMMIEIDTLFVMAESFVDKVFN